MKNSTSISIDDLRRKGLLGAVTASKEEIFGLKGALLTTCRQSGLGLDSWKEALTMAEAAYYTVTRFADQCYGFGGYSPYRLMLSLHPTLSSDIMVSGPPAL